jgi:hypothetical protein
MYHWCKKNSFLVNWSVLFGHNTWPYHTSCHIYLAWYCFGHKPSLELVQLPDTTWNYMHYSSVCRWITNTINPHLDICLCLVHSMIALLITLLFTRCNQDSCVLQRCCNDYISTWIHVNNVMGHACYKAVSRIRLYTCYRWCEAAALLPRSNLSPAQIVRYYSQGIHPVCWAHAKYARPLYNQC